MGRQYFKKNGLKVSHQFHYTAQNPTVGRARNIAELVINQFLVFL
jgi:F-type H+-transporting ATPase subunit gamma